MGLFDIFKQPKQGADWAKDELLKQLFPGGEPEKQFKAEIAYRICNGKCDIKQSLAVYVSVASDYWLKKDMFDGETHLGVTAEALMNRAVETSGGRLDGQEAARMVYYVLLKKEEGPNLSAFQTIREWTSAMFGLNGVGTTADSLPAGVGEYGYAATNPIPVRGLLSIPLYFRKLTPDSGQPIDCHRIRSLAVANIDYSVDEYAISSSGVSLCTLFIHGYNQRISKRAPKGFFLKANSSR